MIDEADFEDAAERSKKAAALDVHDALRCSSARVDAAGRELIAMVQEARRGRVPDETRRAEARRAAAEAQAAFLHAARVMGEFTQAANEAIDATLETWRKAPPQGNC